MLQGVDVNPLIADVQGCAGECAKPPSDLGEIPCSLEDLPILFISAGPSGLVKSPVPLMSFVPFALVAFTSRSQ
eukprot:973509-Amphidinium_carterae.1